MSPFFLLIYFFSSSVLSQLHPETSKLHRNSNLDSPPFHHETKTMMTTAYHGGAIDLTMIEPHRATSLRDPIQSASLTWDQDPLNPV